MVYIYYFELSSSKGMRHLMSKRGRVMIGYWLENVLVLTWITVQCVIEIGRMAYESNKTNEEQTFVLYRGIVS